MAGEDFKSLLERLRSEGPSRPPESRQEQRRMLDALTDEERRLEAYWTAVRRLIPEPPMGWQDRVRPPGSAPRTSGAGKAQRTP